MSEQLYTKRHNKVCRVIHWHICKNFQYLSSRKLMESWTKSGHWKQGSKAHIRSDDPIELIEVSVSRKFGLNIEIKKMTKYKDLKNEVKRSWKLKRSKIVPVIIIVMGMTKKNLMEMLKTSLGILLQTNCSWKLSGVWWRSLKDPSEQNFENKKTSQLGPWIVIP